jgi:hypothetical protein
LQVVLYLSKKCAYPKIIYLVARSRPHQKVTELVEQDMPVGEVKALLESRGLAASFPPGASIYCKRGDGSTVPLRVDPNQSIMNLESKIRQQEVGSFTCIFTIVKILFACEMPCEVFLLFIWEERSWPVP